MTKILYLVTKNDVGGAQKYVNDLVENLDSKQFETKIIHGGKTGARFLSNRLWPHFLFINDWLALFELFFTLRREKPDVAHLNSSKAGVLGSIAAKLAGVPKVIFTAHGWVFNPDNNLDALRRRFYILLHKIAARFQDTIINVSEYDRRLAIQYKIAAPEKLVTVYNGVDGNKIGFLDKKTARKALNKMITSVMPAKAGIQDGSRIKSGMTNQEIWIGSVGRLVTEKNYENFIEAASQIPNPEVKFFIIGSGLQKKRLQSLITRNQLQNRFFIIENVSPAAPYLKAFDVFALSSVKEGFPYTMLEAIAAGIPIVVTRVGGMTEIINPPDQERRGLVMPPRESEELARAIKYMIENREETEKMSLAAKKFLKDNLTLKIALRKIETIYKDFKDSSSF